MANAPKIATEVAGKLSKSGGTMTGEITFSNGKKDSDYLPLTGGVINGDLEVTGNVTVHGANTEVTSQVVQKLGSSTVGSVAQPIYLYEGTPYACSYNFTNYLPLTGGTVTGSITINSANGYFIGNLYGNANTATVATKLGTAIVGSVYQPIFLNEGVPTAFSVSVGSTSKPVFMNKGVITQCSATVGDVYTPIFMNEGTFTALSVNIGNASKPIYMKAGALTQCSATVGGVYQPVYMNEGTITAFNASAGNATNPIYLKDGVITRSDATIGAANQPIYMYEGSLAATTSTIGNNTRPIYMDTGVIKASTNTAGSSTSLMYMNNGSFATSDASLGNTTKPIYMSEGTFKAFSSSIGSATKPVYVNAGSFAASDASLGNNTKPIYMSEGTFKAFSDSIGSATKPVYVNSGSFAAFSDTIGNNTKPVYLNEGSITAFSGNIGDANTPVYVKSGSITSTGKSFADYLPLSGGKMTGAITSNLDTFNIKNNITTGIVVLAAGNNATTSSADCAHLRLHGGTRESNPGYFYLRAGANETAKTLQGTPAGSLTWSGSAIQTSSDETLKQDISVVPDEVLDAWGNVDWVQFRYKEDVEAKGDSARYHTGLVAQRIVSKADEKDVNILAYGIACKPEVSEDSEEDGNKIWTVRYEEALSMEVAYLRRENKKLKERMDALEELLMDIK